MKESIYTYFDVGTVLWMSYPPAACPEGGGEPLLKILRDDFFTCVEVTQEKDDAARRRVRDLLAQSHMRVCYGAQPRLLST
ncbi:MAG: sugar phosphate isomerase/epimerase, partial [Lachnospiraceae bacterium]|nr:sugar phosphate isomerase/epimerase [Lachnospiraceae bacterium]